MPPKNSYHHIKGLWFEKEKKTRTRTGHGDSSFLGPVISLGLVHDTEELQKLVYASYPAIWEHFGTMHGIN